MKYGKGYAYCHNTINAVARTFYYKKNELSIIKSLLVNKKNKKILDLGCNLGHYTNLYQTWAKDSQVIGADINKEALKIAKEKHQKLKFYQLNNSFYKKNKFDVIVISHVLEHVKEGDEFLTKISSLLNKDGEIIISVPQERIRGDASIFQYLYNMLRFRFENPHVVKINLRKLNNMMFKKGFTFINKKYSNFFYPFKSDNKRIHAWSLVASYKKLGSF